MDERTLQERVQRIEQFLHNDLGLPEYHREDIGIDLSGREQAQFSNCKKTIVGVAGKWGAQPGCGSDARDRTSLEEILTQLTSVAEHGEVIAGRLEDMGNRVYGPTPEEDRGKSDIAQTPEALVDRLFLACARLDHLVARLENAQERVCRIA